jgi:hypothetical protein
MTISNDPLEVAGAATLAPRNIYGQMTVSSGFVILVKGQGKVTFDPTSHKISDRRTAIKLELIPLPEHEFQYSVTRDMLAESTEWVKITLDSLKALNVEPRALNDRWCSVTLATTGRTYTNKKGETQEATTFKFLHFYPDEAACRKAYEDENGAAVAQEAQAQPAQSNPARETAAKFLQAVWKTCDGDLGKLQAKIEGMPALSQHFQIDSPEVMALFDTEAKPF